jgi:DNA (cytosine-5)-methyltransferase 1
LLQEEVDEDKYPEKYRKVTNIRGSNLETPEPLRVARIIRIMVRYRKDVSSSDQVLLRVAKFYRPENTHRDLESTRRLDLNLLYWSDEGM